MAAGTQAIFVAVPKAPQVRISTANTARDGTGTLGTAVTAGANGAFYRHVRVTPEVAVPAGDVVRLFRQVGGAGNNELLVEIPIPPTNPAASATGAPPLPAIPSIIWRPDGNDGLVLGAGDILKASTDQGKTYCVSAEGGGDY